VIGFSQICGSYILCDVKVVVFLKKSGSLFVWKNQGVDVFGLGKCFISFEQIKEIEAFFKTLLNLSWITVILVAIKLVCDTIPLIPFIALIQFCLVHAKRIHKV